jgi:chromosome segregation protein
VAEAEAAALRAETAHSAARQALDVARGPLAEAERRAQRLDTESKTLAKLLHIDTKNLWPAVIDALTVDKGYETALGAALGDDLEAPIDPSAPMRWAGATVDPTDPALPDGVEALGEHVKAPQELARRLAQIGVIGREHAARLAPMLKPGQRLVSREGDLWRWDGFSVAANAPTGAARRLAGKNRLSDIEAELEAMRREVDTKQTVVTAAETEVASAAEAEAGARTRWRALQHEAHAARDRFAEAEREMARNAARLSALGEAKARLTASRDEAAGARDDAERALTALPPALDIETRLASVKGEIESQRTRLAEVRAEAQALAREAEISARRLAAIAAERQAWSGRNDSAASQIKTLDTRVEEARSERAGLEDAPRVFEEKRLALISEIETAENARRNAADSSHRRMHSPAIAPRAALEEHGRARRPRARRSVLKAANAGSPTSPMRFTTCWKSSPRRSPTSPPSTRARRCRRWPRWRPTWSGCVATANGSAPSTYAPRKSSVRSRLSMARSPPSATIWSKRSSGCGKASRTSTARRANACSLPSRWSTPISSTCSRSCSAAAPRNCS